MAEDIVRVGIYARISEDRDGQQTATARQLDDCRGFCQRRGWEIADEFEDIDLSAYQKKVQRPEFERMLDALRAGEVNGIVVWKFDRLTRQQRDLVRVMDACEPHKAFIASVMEPIDTRETHGQFVAELLVAQARMESANSSARQRRKAAELARLGQPSVGGIRSFGYNLHRTEIIEEEAALIREAVELVLAGQSIRGIALDWERRGVRSPAGIAWQRAPLRRMLQSPVLSAQREHNGVLTPGNWQSIISPETTARVRAILSSGSRRSSPGNARRYLLSGFLRCGRCGQLLISRPRADQVRRYVCNKLPGRPNCGQLAIRAEPVDELVLEMIVEALDGDALAAALRGRDDGHDVLIESIRKDEEALERLSADYYVENVISREEFLSARARLSDRVEASRAKLARRSANHVLGGLVGGGHVLRERWPSETLDRKRAIIGAVMDHIVIGPGVRGSKKFDPERVQPVWRY